MKNKLLTSLRTSFGRVRANPLVRSLLRLFRMPAFTIPLALLLACFLAYGVLIPWLGFYWDDWPTLWYLNRFGPGVFHLAYGVDRPALGWLFTLTTTLVGESPQAWQLFAILTRWIACLSLWALLRAVWPARILETAWVAFLFALYPGFLQHPIAFTYSADWIAISLLFTSFWLMLRAARGGIRPLWRILFLLLSWFLAAYVMFADEYYFGLELLRPIFLWIVLEGLNTRKRLLKVSLYWLPYVLLMAGFLYWRLVIFVSPRGTMILFDQLASHPIQALRDLAVKILNDLYQASLAAWVQGIRPLVGADLPVRHIGYILLALFSAALAAWYFYTLSRTLVPSDAPPPANSTAADSPPSSKPSTFTSHPSSYWGLKAMLIGLYALLVGGWPFWVTDLPIELRFPWDRFTLALMFGASLFLVGLVVWLIRKSWQQALILGAITGLAIGFHFYNGNTYRQEWALQKEFFWQLTWRAPGLNPGTLLLTTDLPFMYYSDNSLTAPLNLIYAPDNRTLDMSFMLYNLESRLGAGLPDLKKDQPIKQVYRAALFTGNSNNSLVFFFDPPRCLKVIDPVNDRLTPNKPGKIDEAADLSNLDLIQTNPAAPALPPPKLFGPEPEPNWCYYFLKAELAGQQGDWQEASRLADLAFRLPQKVTREKAAELTPFVKAYAHTARWSEAFERTQQAFRLNPKLADTLCPIWYDFRTKINSNQVAAFNQVIQELSCIFPK